MQNTVKFYPVLLAFVLALSLFFKHETYPEPVEDDKAISSYVELTGYDFIRAIKPVNRGNFHIQFYGHKTCDGLLALLVLDKNEEGAAILAHYLKKPVNEIRFIFRSHPYSEFPAFKYWLNSLLPGQSVNHVYAVAEFGQCNLIEKTDWSQI